MLTLNPRVMMKQYDRFRLDCQTPRKRRKDFEVAWYLLAEL
jgi:hypothetical protein